MQEHVYKVIEIAGSSETSIQDAIQTAVSRASRTLKNLRRVEVLQTAVISKTARSSITRSW